ncbi:LLM class flavin-dependent oxidoreductase [Rhizobiaceae bacterium BDR2-2]|uniref:LLM class flavin-dependent oxidoreductase n=1 Tax=Ectorhizobium quercum TaxID=2965071 RepID=A0AAE3SUS9_9HYPH|nr:LLM class flavin-dependent oxidoreductase [Ectorhizobium quercum]MCX8997432.1 LLM class flavin-dependent oxidoreductase [Ectorhizobium quercum]
MARKLALGAFLHGFGHHQAGWRHPSTDPDSEFSLRHYVKLATIAERGTFDLVFLADAAGWRDWEVDTMKHMSRSAILEPLTLLTALAVSTSRIGLVATASTTYYEPYTVARLFASIDHISGGRAGWNLVTSTTESEARNFSLAAQIPHSERYARADEFAEVVRGLWDSWDDDAFPRDKETALYFDPDRVRRLNHKGKYFSVQGPLNVPRSPQGHPVMVQAGSSEAGRELASKTADLVFTAQPTIEAAQAFYADLKGRMAAHGRAPDELRILPGIVPTIGRTLAEAEARQQELQELVPPAVGLAQLRDLFGGFDLSGYPLDGPLPDIPETEGGKTRRQILIDMARCENLSIRQLYQKTTAARGFLSIVGTPEMVADEMQRWFEEGAADGFNVMAPVMSRDLEDFVDLVVPILKERGLMHDAYVGTTLREHLGLRRPLSPFRQAQE